MIMMLTFISEVICGGGANLRDISRYRRMSSGYILNWKTFIILLTLTCLLNLLTPAIHAQGGSNELWFLISSYEDIGITVQDLSQFLVAHGYNARPEMSYVTVTLTSGGKVYLTPNGGAPGLADMWMNPPERAHPAYPG